MSHMPSKSPWNGMTLAGPKVMPLVNQVAGGVPPRLAWLPGTEPRTLIGGGVAGDQCGVRGVAAIVVGRDGNDRHGHRFADRGRVEAEGVDHDHIHRDHAVDQREGQLDREVPWTGRHRVLDTGLPTWNNSIVSPAGAEPMKDGVRSLGDIVTDDTGITSGVEPEIGYGDRRGVVESARTRSWLS